MSEGSKASSHGRSREVSYSAKRVYMNEEQYVWKPSEGHAKSSIFPGCHVYPFKFQIPARSPPSFEGDHGNIRYHIKVTVERPWKTNRSITKYFTVLPSKDLNLDPVAKEEANSWKSKKVGFFFFRCGKVNLGINLRKKGHVPGETICIDVGIENNSSLTVTKAECHLIQQCRFLAYRYGIGGGSTAGLDPSYSVNENSGSDRYLSRKRDETRIATNCQMINVAPRTEMNTKMRLKIPCICPNFDSSLIHIEYHVLVKLHVKCRIRKSVKVECPVIIGSVPLIEPNIEPRTPTFGEVTVFSNLTQRSIMSVDEKITPKYVYYPKYGKSKADEVDDPPSISDLQLPPIDSLSEDD